MVVEKQESPDTLLGNNFPPSRTPVLLIYTQSGQLVVQIKIVDDACLCEQTFLAVMKECMCVPTSRERSDAPSSARCSDFRVR